MSTNEDNKLAVFQGKRIRKVFHEDEWWFVITDIIAALTDAADPSDYWKKLRKRDPDLGRTLALEFATAGGTGLQSRDTSQFLSRLHQK